MTHPAPNDPSKDQTPAPSRGLLPGLPPHTHPGPLSGQSRVSLAVALALAFFLIAVVADGPVRDLAQSLDPSLRAVLRVVTDFGKSHWPILSGLAVLAIVWALRRRAAPALAGDLAALRSAALFLIYSVAGSGILVSLIKNSIGRMRPSTVDNAQVLEFSVMAFRSGWASFPSGHATTATAAALVLAWCFPRFAWAFLALGLTAALSRAFLGVHWLTDCLAGILLGGVVTLLIHNAMLRRGHTLPVPRGAFRRLLAEAWRQLRQGAQGLRRRVGL